MELKDLKEYAELAKRILESGTPYQYNKDDKIKPLFEEKVTNDEDYKKLVKKRLKAVAKFHSTTIRFNLQGIDDLVDALVEYSDEDLKNRANNFLTPIGDEEIKRLLYKTYGTNETEGRHGRIEISLVSAYLCFLTKDDFPICNEPVKYSYMVIKPKRSPLIDKYNFFRYIRELKKETKIEKYGTLDNLLWLMGNILSGSFRIIMSEGCCSVIVKKEKVEEKLLGKNHRRKKDDIIRDYIRKNYKGSDLFTTDQKKFFDFAFDLYDTMELRIRSAYSRGGKP